MSKTTEMKPGIIKYSIGFGLSLVFTLTAFGMVAFHIASRHEELPHTVLLPAIVLLAVAQFVAQLFFFLHLGREARPRWNVITFLFMLVVLVILVLGSLWIMANLNYHQMTPGEINAYMHEHQGGF
jgi:cytochrome o ubiquinol oxidase subunit IV